MKKFLCVLLASLMIFSVLTACSKPPSDEEKTPEKSVTKRSEEPKTTEDTKKSDVKLFFMSNIVGAQFEVLDNLAKDFKNETGITIETSSPGESYEKIMKTKMAARDLPDLWTTHGWSVARYSEYLRPLNDQPWSNNINPSIDPLIRNDKGELFVIPMDVDQAGIVYNKTVLEKSDVNVDNLKTWDDFEAGMEKIKAKGFTPIHIGGKDPWTIGQFFDWVAPSLYITNKNKNYRKEFKDGTFDWKLWEEIATVLDSWNKKGYFNKDCLTADYMAATKSLAENKIAFEFYGNYAITEAMKINPDVKLGMMPVPSNSPDDKPTLIGGERTAIGVWNETKYEKEALQFINFLAKPANMEKVATSNSLPAGLKGVPSEKGVVSEDYDKYANLRTFPYFDREYLPSGMWDDFCTTGSAILSGKSNAIQDTIKQMEQSFKDKFSQQN